jgi:hypothetical protein
MPGPVNDETVILYENTHIKNLSPPREGEDRQEV